MKPEHAKSRLGIPTASRFADLMSDGRAAGTTGAPFETYLWEKIAELETGTPKEEIFSKATEWGLMNEPDALDLYEFRTDTRLNFRDKDQVLLQKPTLKCGGSPDGLIFGENDTVVGGVEAKCPYNTTNHLKVVYSGIMPDEHKAQVQGLMLITGAEWWDFISYDPRMLNPAKRLVIIRQYPDEEYLRKLESRIRLFNERIGSRLNVKAKRSNENLNTEENANSDLGALDYSLKNGEKVWFTHKIKPKEESDWIEAKILALNWAYKSAAIQLKGYTGVSCHGISALSRVRHYT